VNGSGPRDREEHRVDAAEVVRALVEARFHGDVTATTALCAPDIVLRIEGSHEARGREGVAHLMEFNREVATNVRVEIHRVMASGDTVAMSRTMFLTINGQAVELSAGAFFTLRDGLVREWSDYLDMSEVARALGH
jgi:ketosteroid isomerase-like protein